MNSNIPGAICGGGTFFWTPAHDPFGFGVLTGGWPCRSQLQWRCSMLWRDRYHFGVLPFDQPRSFRSTLLTTR